MMMNLMTVLVKKVFISSKPSIVCLLCPPPCGPFSIQESAVGGLSYKVKKNPAKQDSPPAAGRASDILPFRCSAILAERLLSYGNEVSYTIIKPSLSPGSSAPANDRKSVSKIFLPRKKPGQACGHILNHNYPFGGS